VWNRSAQGPPSPGDLARYSLVLWHADDRSEQLLKGSVAALRAYLTVGGKVWLVGWRVLPELDNFTGATAHSYASGEFGYDLTHLDEYLEQTDLDFSQAIGQPGYPPLHVDPPKVPGSFSGTLNFVGTMSTRDAKVLYTFGSSKGSSFAGRPCAIAYSGNAYTMVVFGFPLYFMVETDASLAVGKILSDIGE
jgi:hypothetical protein